MTTSAKINLPADPLTICRARYSTLVRCLLLAGLSVTGALSCGAWDKEASVEEQRRLRLDATLGAIAPGLAVAKAYTAYNAQVSCQYASIAENLGEALTSQVSPSDALARTIGEYQETLNQIYAEEQVFCLVYDLAAADMEETVKATLADNTSPAGLYIFYARPRGIMHDIRSVAHEHAEGDSEFSAELGYSQGKWLDFKIAEAEELAVGLFRGKDRCETAEMRLSEVGIVTRSCRNWESEPVHLVEWNGSSSM